MLTNLGREAEARASFEKALSLDPGLAAGQAGLATLAVPDAVALGIQPRNYNSASPKVGLANFKSYYESLKVETFRLVNKADTVPDFPGSPYVHVDTQVSFNADYGAEKKKHNPCCSYAYAVFHPSQPCNPDYDGCAKQAG